MRPYLIAIALFAIAAAGCAPSRASEVVGTWKGAAPERKTDSAVDGFKNFVSGMVSGMMSFEFNDKGRFKMTVLLSSQEGNYTVSGSDVKIESDDGKTKADLVLSSDGKTLTSRKDFTSDDVFVLKKEAN